MPDLSASPHKCPDRPPCDAGPLEPASSQPSGTAPAQVVRRVLCGMISKGHGIELLCSYLGLTRTALLDLVVGLDLPTPHDRQVRRPGGRNPWPFGDTAAFIVLWMAGWRAESLALRFGRTRGGIWAKARQVGLPGRDRKLLFSPSPSELVASGAPGPADGSSAASGLPGRGEAAPVPGETPPHAVKDEGTSPVQALTGAPSPSAERAATNPALSGVPAGQPGRAIAGSDLFGPVPAGPALKPKQRRKEVEWTRERDVELAQRWWARQHYKAIARDMGLTPSAVQSRRFRVGLPSLYDLEDLFIFRREELVEHFDPGVVAAHIAAAGYVERRCNVYAQGGKQFWFWSKRRDGRYTSPEQERLEERRRNRKPSAPARTRSHAPALTYASSPL